MYEIQPFLEKAQAVVEQTVDHSFKASYKPNEYAFGGDGLLCLTRDYLVFVEEKLLDVGEAHRWQREQIQQIRTKKDFLDYQLEFTVEEVQVRFQKLREEDITILQQALDTDAVQPNDDAQPNAFEADNVSIGEEAQSEAHILSNRDMAAVITSTTTVPVQQEAQSPQQQADDDHAADQLHHTIQTHIDKYLSHGPPSGAPEPGALIRILDASSNLFLKVNLSGLLTITGSVIPLALLNQAGISVSEKNLWALGGSLLLVSIISEKIGFRPRIAFLPTWWIALGLLNYQTALAIGGWAAIPIIITLLVMVGVWAYSIERAEWREAQDALKGIDALLRSKNHQKIGKKLKTAFFKVSVLDETKYMCRHNLYTLSLIRKHYPKKFTAKDFKRIKHLELALVDFLEGKKQDVDEKLYERVQRTLE